MLEALARWTRGLRPAKPQASPPPSPVEEDTARLLEWKAFYEREGYLILRGWFSPEEVDRLRGQALSLWDEPRNERLVVDFGEGDVAGKRMLLKDAPDHARQYNQKINDLYLESDAFRSDALSLRLSRLLETLIDGKPSIINSLHFAVGSQQRAHYDSWYMPPGVEDRMAVAAIPLEPYVEDNGPLFYYPRSHLIPKYRFSSGHIRAIEEEMPACDAYIDTQLAERGLQPEIFYGEPGDLFIWHSQLYHGGMPVKDGRLTRRSIVVHYWRAGDVDQTPEYGYLHGAETASHSGFYLARNHQAVTS